MSLLSGESVLGVVETLGDWGEKHPESNLGFALPSPVTLGR